MLRGLAEAEDQGVVDGEGGEGGVDGAAEVVLDDELVAEEGVEAARVALAELEAAHA